MSSSRHRSGVTATAAALLALSATTLVAQRPVAPAYSRVAPKALVPSARPLARTHRIAVARVDRPAVAAEDIRRAAAGLPRRYAIPNRVRVTPATGGTWETLADGTRMWRLRIGAPGATSINLGFHDFALPPKARVLIYSADHQHQIRPFTAADNKPHRQLWTPILPSDEIVIELLLPKHGQLVASLTLVQVGYGYRDFQVGARLGRTTNGFCDIDVVCPQGNSWRDEIDTVSVISIGGSLACTGFMINNTALDQRPFFMTAAHCGLTASTVGSLVVYWNHQASRCAGSRDGHFRDFQTGAKFRAAWGPSDCTLVELDASPNPSWNVQFAGWDRTGKATPGAITIHQPDTKEKRISFENNPTVTTSYYGNSSPGDGTHVRVMDWDLGSTEPGSSGSPLFDLNHRVIGQLHGGRAACGNNLPDWYGRLSVSWNGGGSKGTRLRDWLDPINTGATTLDTYGPAMHINPTGPSLHSGPHGGPFTNPTTTYTLTNRSTTAIQYSISVNATGYALLNGSTTTISGSLAANGGTRGVLVTLPSKVSKLTPGAYATEIHFRDQTNGVSNRKLHKIEVGRTTVFSFDFSQHPGWTKEGNWNFGRPRGFGGSGGGYPDPRAGKTGSNVWGFNLNGDYPSNLPVRNLTTKAINCRGLTGVRVRFWRWLNVEEAEYDHARLLASKNGTNWVVVWANSGEVADSRWTWANYDISDLADGEQTVYLRWTMGPTDGSVEYSGWNIDDVTISAMPLGYFTSYGSGCASSTGRPILNATGLPSPGGTITFTVTTGAPNGTGIMFVSPLANIPGTACIHLGPPLLGPITIPLNASGAGFYRADLPIGIPRDVHIFLQVLTVAGSNVATSNGLNVLIK